MSTVKLASAVIALVLAIAGGLYAFDQTYLRCAMFEYHQHEHLEDKLDRTQKRIWDTQDRVKEEPNNRMLQERLRELEWQKQRIIERLEKGGTN